MKTVGPANKRKGSKTGCSPHPSKGDNKFGSKTNYADFSKTQIKIGGKKG